RFSPAFDLAVSGTWNDTDQEATLLGTSITTTAKLSGPQLEGQMVFHQGRRMVWIAGVGGFDRQFQTKAILHPTALKGDETFVNAYGYLKIRDLGPFEVTGGVAVED